MNYTSEFRQAILSRGTADFPGGEELWPNVIMLDPKKLPLSSRMILRLPTRIRRRWGEGNGSRAMLGYAWQIIEQLQVAKPKLLICYDVPWLGRILRPHLTWPCRVILSQRGESFYVDDQSSVEIYSHRFFDVVWNMSLAAYRFDRNRISSYESAVKILPNCVDDERFSPVSEETKKSLRRKWDLPSDRPVVLFLSVLRPKKGAHLLVEAWREVLDQVPDAMLWVVGGEDTFYGDGYLQRMQRTVEALNLSDRICFQGSVDPDLTHECYQASDLYVFPTLFGEGWGLSITEALACGIPCIASDYPVGQEVFSDNEVLFVPDPNIIGAFVDPIVSMLKNQTIRSKMAQAGRSLVSEHFSYRAVAPQLIQFYKQQMQLVAPSFHQTDI